ncbi:hypothetical protein LCGC14_0467420 [marine sediment metagenome]|uniref:Uncharacterized protein n=1 Tax=marine sediment metagenome TaxID=412755 RepID=A0A0F9SIK4_9ZZZZ
MKKWEVSGWHGHINIITDDEIIATITDITANGYANARLIAAAPDMLELLKMYPWECTCKEDGRLTEGTCYGCRLTALVESLEA